MEAFLARVKTGGVFGLFTLFVLLTHLPFLNYPPQGMHVWRQCNTLAMSRNFLKEDMNIFHPRIDRRNDRDGVTGSHFPLYEWGLALIWKLSGESETMARIYSMLLFSGTMTAFYLLLLSLGSLKWYAFLSSLILNSVPQLYYDSINAMPDLMSLMLALTALLSVIRYLSTGKPAQLFLFTVLASLAGAVKFQYLLIPFSGIAFYSDLKKRNVRLVSAMLIPLLVTFAWFRYALWLTEISNLREFGLWITPVPPEKWLPGIRDNLMSDLPEKLTGWPLLLSIIISSWYYRNKLKRGKTAWQVALWGGGFLLFYIIAFERMMNHGYYFIAIIPLFVFIHHKLIQGSGKAGMLLSLICILNLSFAMLRIIPGRWSVPGMAIAEEFADPVKRASLSILIPDGKVVIGPDISGCIYFYFTDTEGYSFEHASELFLQKQDGLYIEEMIANGVQTLVIRADGQTAEMLKPLQGKRLIGNEGTFQVWDISRAFIGEHKEDDL